jgi:hypothetical protein
MSKVVLLNSVGAGVPASPQPSEGVSPAKPNAADTAASTGILVGRTRSTEPHHFETARFLICGFVLFFLATKLGVQAQSVQVNRAELARAQAQASSTQNVPAPGLESGQAVASPNDSDLGVQEVLKRTEEYQPFSASIASPIYYTSNVALTNSGERGDLVTAPVAGVYYQPRITQTFYGFADVRQQLFYYNQYNDLDFGSMDVEAGLSYILPQFHNLALRGEYDFNRLTFTDRVLDEFFQNHSLIFSAEIPFRINRAQQLSVGGDANISIAADHQAPRRNDYEAYASYALHLTRALSLNAVGRVVVRDYHQNDRTDVSEILAVTATYALTDWWSVSAISTFARSDSNQDVFDYSVANVGGAMALTVKF